MTPLVYMLSLIVPQTKDAGGNPPASLVLGCYFSSGVTMVFLTFLPSGTIV